MNTVMIFFFGVMAGACGLALIMAFIHGLCSWYEGRQ